VTTKYPTVDGVFQVKLLADGDGASRLFRADVLLEHTQILQVQPETGPMFSTVFASG
jgi:hypothetical protein